MKTFSLNKIFYLKSIPQVLLGSIFILSGISKIFSSDSFIINLQSITGIQAESIILLLSFLLIAVEIVLGFCLLLSIKTELSIITAGLFVLAFLFYNSYKILQGDNSDCGCFGSLIKTDNTQIIVCPTLYCW